MSINADVTKKVKQLKAKVQKEWLWENFWQEEIRYFQDKFSKTYGVNINYVNISHPPSFSNSRKAAQFKRDYWAIIQLRNWAPNFAR